MVSQVPKVGPGAPGSHAAQGCAVKREILQSIPELSHGQLIVLSFAGRNLLNYGRRKLRIKRGMSCRLSEGGPMKIKGPFTPSDVAAWMLSEFNRNQVLFHDIAACRIREQFGTEFTCLTEDGNFSIEPRVLLAFRIMTKDTVVWERRKRYWRKRADYDEPGRSQDSVRRAMSQRAQDVSKFLTAHAGQAAESVETPGFQWNAVLPQGRGGMRPLSSETDCNRLPVSVANESKLTELSVRTRSKSGTYQ